MKIPGLPALLFTALLFSTVFTSCGKYDDGPKFSLLTKKARLSRDWQVYEYEDSDGTTVSVSNSSDYATFEKDGTYKATFDNVSYAGTWEFSSNKEDLLITYNYGGFSLTTASEIRRLTNDELWLKDEDNNFTRLKAK